MNQYYLLYNPLTFRFESFHRKKNDKQHKGHEENP